MFNIWVTRNCNLACKYCYEGKNKTEAIFSTESVDNLIQFIKDNNVREDVNINFHGGEPFLALESMKAIAQAVEREFEDYAIGVTTNGTIVTDDVIAFIYHYISELTISIDGNKETHDCNRCYANGAGSYDMVIKNIQKIQNAGIENIRYRLTFNHETVGALYDNIVGLAKEGIDRVTASPDYFDKMWDEESVALYKVQLEKLKKLRNSREADFFIPLVDKEEFKPRPRCYGGIGSYNIDCDGSVYPCTYTVGNSKYKIGSIKEGIDKQSIDKIECDIYKQEVSECSDCKARLYCPSYRCKFVNELLMEHLFKPAPVVCALTRTELENAFLD